MTPFAEALRAAIDARGVSLVWLRDHLAERGSPASLTTLSYWRSGQRHPAGSGSLGAVRGLEELLEVPEGHLVSLLVPSGAGPRGRSAFPFDDADRRAAIEETFAALEAAPMSQLHVLSAHVAADVDEQGRLARCSYRVLTQVVSGTVTEIPFAEILPTPAAVPPAVSVIAGGTVCRSHHHPDGQVSGFVFATERAVTAPDAIVIEWAVDYPPGYADLSESSCAVIRQAREVIVWVRFHPDKLPLWCEEYTDDDTDVRTVDLGTGTTVHAVRTRFGPGELGVRWGFGPA